MHMFLKFIGQDGSMGFRNDKYYEVRVYSDYHFIWVATKDGRRCPYSTPQAFSSNWR